MKQTTLTAIAGHQTDNGRIVRETAADGRASYRSLIHLRDHLGSICAVIDGDTGSVLEASDYYPFGKRIPAPVTRAVPVTSASSVTVVSTGLVASMAGELCQTTGSATATGSATSQNRWHFSGKESQSFLSASIPFLDFGARMYDPITARWTAQDPLAEEYYAVSPYAYCMGNPVINVDVDGQEIRFFEVSQYLGKTPEYQYSKIVEDANSGEYSVLAYYDSDDNIVGYGASRNGRLEYVMDEANDYSAFIENLPNYSIAADFFYKNGIPSEGMIAMAAGDVSKGLAIQWMNSIKNPSYCLYVINVLATSSSSRNNLAAKARHLYPKKANKFEYHHIDPKYMGGDSSGPTVRIEASYHQMITNEFRRFIHIIKGNYLWNKENRL